MPYTLDNILVTTATGDAYLATDWGTSGTGFTQSHVPINKVAYGDDTTTTRVTTATPLPIYIYGSTGNLGITGTIKGTGTFFVGQTGAGSFLKIAGTTFSTIPVGVSGAIQGMTNGVLVGITGTITVRNTQYGIFGISGATAVGITGGRRLNSTTDSVTVHGNVGISGSINLTESTDSIRVYGHNGDTKVPSKIYASDGTTLGYSGDSLKVAVTNAGFTFSVNIGATVGVANYDSNGLMIKGTGITSDAPVLVKGIGSGGAITVTATSSLPVSIQGGTTFDTSSILLSLGTTGSIYTVLNNIKTNTNTVSSINEKLNNGTIQVKIIDNTKPSTVTSGIKTATTTASQIATTSPRLTSGIHIKASLSNTGVVYVGGNNLLTRSNEGYPLERGESMFLEVGSLTSVYVRSTDGRQDINYIAS